jgi:hypothetical protein
MSILDFLNESSPQQTTINPSKFNNQNKSKVPNPQKQNNTVGPYDVICGRDKLAFNNIGNRRMRVFVEIYLTKYMAAESKPSNGLQTRI